MTSYSIRWRNFRGFVDTGWLHLRPLNIILGPNATGKTSLIAPILLMKQTKEARDAALSLKTKGRYFNAGSFQNLIHRHTKGRLLGFSVRFGDEHPAEEGKNSDPGEYPPCTLDLTFSVGPPSDAPYLLKYEVFDTCGRRMLTRQRDAEGKYSVDSASPLPQDSPWTTVIGQVKPQGFLFTADSVFTEFYRLQRKQKKIDSASQGEFKTELAEAHQLYLNTVSYTAERISSFLSHTYYIGPLRDRPRRIYELGGEKPYSVGPTGAYAPEILFRASNQLKSSVNEWIKKFEFGNSLECKSLAEGVFCITLKRTGFSPSINIADTGFGLSQVLPLIVQGFFARRNSILIAEQPEIHLNPRLQAVLAELFVAVAERGVNIILETHSEHLLLRLRRLVAERRFSADKLAIHFTERPKDESRVRTIPIDSSGHIPIQQWPKGFFEDALADSLALATAQTRVAQ